MKILLIKILFQETGDIQHLRVHTDTQHSGQTFRVTKCQNKVIFQSLTRLMSDSSDLKMKGHLKLCRNSIYHIVHCVSILYIVNCVECDVDCSLYIVVQSLACSVLSIECILYSVVQSLVCSVLSIYRVYTVQCSVVQCRVQSVQC